MAGEEEERGWRLNQWPVRPADMQQKIVERWNEKMIIWSGGVFYDQNQVRIGGFYVQRRRNEAVKKYVEKAEDLLH